MPCVALSAYERQPVQMPTGASGVAADGWAGSGLGEVARNVVAAEQPGHLFRAWLRIDPVVPA
jgi:hypothetical protein